MVLQAYRMGIFPMAETRHAEDIAWYDPQSRGVLPLNRMHVPKRLQRTIRQQPYKITFDKAFNAVITACADARAETWINDEIIALYTQLFERGHAHSVEAWDGDVLAGGVYGISIGSAFFGESMFSVRTDASKIALVYLAARLWRQGYTLFDTQFVNKHISQFGVEEIPRKEYHRRLAAALQKHVEFSAYSSVPAASSAPPSNDPGSCSIGGMGDGLTAGGTSAGLAPAGGVAVAVGEMAAAGLSGAASVSSGSSSGLAGDAAAVSDAGARSFSGACSGVFSDENTSVDFAAVTAFLHSITQTS